MFKKCLLLEPWFAHSQVALTHEPMHDGGINNLDSTGVVYFCLQSTLRRKLVFAPRPCLHFPRNTQDWLPGLSLRMRQESAQMNSLHLNYHATSSKLQKCLTEVIRAKEYMIPLSARLEVHTSSFRSKSCSLSYIHTTCGRDVQGD